MGRPWILAASAFLFLAASPGLAGNHGVPALPGDRFSAEISPSGDADPYVLPLGAGSRLTVEVRAAPGSALLPAIEVRDPDGTPIVPEGPLPGAGSPRVLLRHLPLGATGGWSVAVKGAGGTTGAYEVSFAARVPSRFAVRDLAVSAGDEAPLRFAAGDGDALSFSLRAHGGPPPSGVTLHDPTGAEVAIPPESVAARGRRIVGRAIPLRGPYGTWELRVAAPAGRGTRVSAVLSVRRPPPRRLQSVLGDEPRPASLAPGSGRDGTPFTVVGTGFAPGARVRFGGTWADGVVVAGGTSASGTAPAGPESTQGLRVAVVVANPDGQENAAPATFQYLGIPAPESVEPAFQPLEGGRPLVLRGRNFRPGFTVSIGGVPRPGATLSPLGEILCTSPAREEGTAAVVVTDEFGRSGTLLSGVRYMGPPVPVSVEPPSSSFTGGRVHTLVGTSFLPGARVSVGGVPCEGVEDGDARHVRFRMPPGPAGPLDVTIEDVFGRSATGEGFVSRRGPFRAAPPGTVPGPWGPSDFLGSAVALGDLDGDGDLDILLSSPYARYDPYSYDYDPLPAAAALRNDGAGAFTRGTADLLGGFAHAEDAGLASAILLGDVDGDGREEAVVASAYPVRSASYTFSRSGKTYAYATAGYYGNPYVDPPTWTATRILARGEEGPAADDTARRMPSSSSTPFLGFGERWQAAACALGDLDGDGDRDLVLSAPGPVVAGSVATTTYAGGVYYLLQGYAYVASTRVLENDGSGVFVHRAGALPAPTFMNGAYASRAKEGLDASALALGDLDGDGDPDLVLTRAYPKFVYHLDTGTGKYTTYYLPATRVLRNDGSGAFAPSASALPAPEGSLVPGSTEFWQGVSSALGDLDGDGDLDLVIGRPSAGYWYDPSTTSYRLLPALRLFANDGAGRFSEATSAFLPAAAAGGGGPGAVLDARRVLLGDLDGDGALDLVAAGATYYVYAYAGSDYGPYGFLPAGEHPATRVFLGDGAGRLLDLTDRWLPGPANGDLHQADGAVLGDLDGDGDLDLVLAAEGYPESSGTAQGSRNRPLRILRCE